MQYLIPILLLSQLLIIPGSFRWCKEVSVQILIIITICSLIWQKNKYIALYVLWSMILFFLYKSYFVIDSGNSPQFTINIVAFFNIINIVLYGLFYYVLHQLKLDKTKLYKTFCLIAITQALYIFLQRLNLDQFFYHLSGAYGDKIKKSWCVGLWANEALVGWCMAICSPFFLAFKKLRYKIGYLLTFIAIFLTGATTGIVVFIFGFLFWLFFKYRKLAILLIILTITVGVLLIDTGKVNDYLNDSMRFKVWKKTLSIWANGSGNPSVLDRKTITGYGLSSFRNMFYQQAPEFRNSGQWVQAHNDYLQTLFEQGIIGLGIILCLLFTTFYKFIKKRKGLIPATSLAVFSLVTFNGFPMHTAMGILFVVALVLFEKELEDGA